MGFHGISSTSHSGPRMATVSACHAAGFFKDARPCQCLMPRSWHLHCIGQSGRQFGVSGKVHGDMGSHNWPHWFIMFIVICNTWKLSKIGS